MELRQLEYFVAVARHGSFTRAAEELYVTQSALSQQVRRLEAELGLALLTRGARGVEPTPAGADLLRRAQAALAEVAAARAELDRHAGVESGVVRVAATAADGLRLPAALAAFHGDHPGVRIALRQGSAREVTGLVQAGAVDVAVLALAGDEPRPGAGLEARLLSDEPLWVALPPGGGDPAEPLALWDLRDRPFVLPEPGTALRETIMGACEAAGFGPVPMFEVGEPATVRFLVHAAMGVSMVPESWLAADGPAIRAAALAGPAPRHRLYLLAPDAGLSPAAAVLYESLRDGHAEPGGLELGG